MSTPTITDPYNNQLTHIGWCWVDTDTARAFYAIGGAAPLTDGERLTLLLNDYACCRRLLDGNSGHTRPFDNADEGDTR